MSPSPKKTQLSPLQDAFVGRWAYRSLLNEPDLSQSFDQLEFGRATLEIVPAAPQTLKGTIGGSSWQLDLHGSRAYGSPMEARFQGKGFVGDDWWVYDYVCWLVPNWPWSEARLQRPALVGSVVRTIAHKSSSGGVSPAGVTASFYAVRMDD